MPNQQVAELLSFAQGMMALVDDEDWATLAQKQKQQDGMVRAFFARPDLRLSAQDETDLFALKKLNDELLKAVESRKNDVANEIRTIKRGKAKTQAYTSI